MGGPDPGRDADQVVRTVGEPLWPRCHEACSPAADGYFGFSSATTEEQGQFFSNRGRDE